MKKGRVLILIPVAVFCILAVAAEAQKQKLGAKANANGGIGEEAKVAAAAAVASTTACVELHNGGAVFPFSLTIDPNAYPFKVTGGSVKGSLCDAAKWQITGGSLGGTLTINAKYTGSASCAKTMVVKGNAQQPPSWGGTYTFDGTATFKHESLFKGYNACP